MNIPALLMARKGVLSGEHILESLMGSKLSGGGGGTETTITGISPLLLENAMAKELKSLTQYGKCAQSGTPTPSAPKDIYCNNGKLVARHASGLPTGHTLVETVYNASSTSAATNIKDDVDDVEYEIRVKPNNGSWYIFQSRATTTAYIYGISGSSSGQTITFVYGLPTGLTSGIGARNPDHIYLVRASHKNGVATLYVRDETTGEEDTQTTTYNTADFTPSTVNLRFWGNSQNTINAGNYIYHAKLWKSGDLVLDAVPDKYGSAAGLFDYVSGSFIASAGTLYAGDPVDDPVIVVADGTPEVLTVSGTNMANVNADTALVGYYISSSGVVAEDQNNWLFQDFIPVKPSTKYTLSMDTALYYVTISEYSSADDSGFIRRNAGSTGGNTSLTITTRSNTQFIRFGANIKSAAITIDDVLAIKWMLNSGGSAMAYQPYVAPQTASVVNLFGLGDVADTQEIIGGAVTRKVGIKVFDGTESFTYTTADFIYRNSTLRTPAGTTVFCTHFVNATAGSVANMPDLSCRTHPSTDGPVYFRMNSAATADAFKAFLAAEYAAGTPVILVYALEESTTESVEPQHLHTTEGDNTISVTAEVSGITLEAAYMAKSA